MFVMPTVAVGTLRVWAAGLPLLMSLMPSVQVFPVKLFSEYDAG